MTKVVKCDDLVLGKRVVLPKTVEITGGRIVLGDDVQIGEDVMIDVRESLVVGKGSIIRPRSIIRGRDIVLGREFYCNHDAEIGGGSCFEKTSRLRVGCWGYLRSYSIINTSMPVQIGDEVGLGANLYTHGAYLSVLDGFPVQFAPITLGSRVWLPGGCVNPGVTIGDDVVVGVGSVVTRDLPSGCLAIGAPARVVRKNAYPVRLTAAEKLRRVRGILRLWEMPHSVVDPSVPSVRVDRATFDFKRKSVAGRVSTRSEQARNYLRRHGIRFKVETDTGEYEPWREG